MDHKDFLYFILSRAFLILRDEGATIQNNKVHKISHFLHNIPDKLKNADLPEDFEEVFESLKSDAKLGKLGPWFESILDTYERDNQKLDRM